MKKTVLLSLLLSISIYIFAQESSADDVRPKKLKKQKFEWVSFKIPSDFVVVEDEAFFRNTASAVKPETAYRDPSAQVSFTINNSINKWGRNMVLLQQFQRSNILAMHKRVSFLRDEIVEIKERKYLIMMFDSKIDDGLTFIGS